MAKLLDALVFSVITQYALQFLSLATIVVVARVLSPDEVGVFAVASAIVLFAIEMQSLGVGQFLIREPDISIEQTRSALGVATVVSWTLAGTIAAGAPFLADFYGVPALAAVLWIIVPNFLLAPFSAIPSALLRRRMQFRTMFRIKLFAGLARAGSTIILVVMGFSYYGLAIGAITGSVAEFIGLSLARPADTPWRPSFKGITPLFRFGFLTSSAGALAQFSRTTPDLVLGRVATMADVGLYSRALGLILFINRLIGDALAPVVLPHLAGVRRSGDSVPEAYVTAASLASGVAWPVLGVVSVLPLPLIRAMFGDQWDAAAPAASALALWGLLAFTHGFLPSALLAVGHEGRLAQKEAIVFASRLALVLVAAPYGLMAVAWAVVLSGAFEVCVATWIVNRFLGVKLSALVAAFRASAIVMLACSASSLLIVYTLDTAAMNPWAVLSVQVPLAALTWLAAVRLTGHGLWSVARDLYVSRGLARAPARGQP